jgi:peptidoglycan/xylan/chitin deacetylase (PgdA/CDA1 family)
VAISALRYVLRGFAGVCCFEISSTKSLTSHILYPTFAAQVGRNICHGSDSVENAEREIGLWFDDGEVLDWTDHSFDWVYE